MADTLELVVPRQDSNKKERYTFSLSADVMERLKAVQIRRMSTADLVEIAIENFLRDPKQAIMLSLEPEVDPLDHTRNLNPDGFESAVNPPKQDQ